MSEQDLINKFEQDFGEGILTDAGYDALKGGFQKSLELSLYKSLNYAATTDFIRLNTGSTEFIKADVVKTEALAARELADKIYEKAISLSASNSKRDFWLEAATACSNYATSARKKGTDLFLAN